MGAKVVLGVIYVSFACICLASSAFANATLQDPSLFIPVSNAVNLVSNCLAGLCIWGDAARLSYRWSYCMIYLLVLLGTYLLSARDIDNIWKPTPVGDGPLIE